MHPLHFWMIFTGYWGVFLLQGSTCYVLYHTIENSPHMSIKRCFEVGEWYDVGFFDSVTDYVNVLRSKFYFSSIIDSRETLISSLALHIQFLQSNFLFVYMTWKSKKLQKFSDGYSSL